MKNITFSHFDSDPRFPHFYYMLGANLGSLLYGDVSVMRPKSHVVNKTNKMVCAKSECLQVI